MNRPAAHVFHTALAGVNDSKSVTLHVPSDVGRANELDAISYVGGLGSADENVNMKTVEVPCTTMDDVLGQVAGIPKAIDFAVIDVEGAEMSLLSGFDLTTHRPRVIVIEDNTLGRDRSVHDDLSARNYTFVGYLVLNRVYVDAAEPDLVAKAQAELVKVLWPHHMPVDIDC